MRMLLELPKLNHYKKIIEDPIYCIEQVINGMRNYLSECDATNIKKEQEESYGSDSNDFKKE